MKIASSLSDFQIDETGPDLGHISLLLDGRGNFAQTFKFQEDNERKSEDVKKVAR